ncbi:MAG: DUF3310 domain-containing protein [Pseudomonadota bacterium]
MKDINPDHYTSTSIEPIEAIEAWGLGFNLGNAIKYIARAGRKGNRRSDLIKAANYAYREATGEWLPEELLHQPKGETDE